MKRTLVAATAALTLLASALVAQPPLPQNGMNGPKPAAQSMQKKRNKKARGMKSVFLIRHGLPHYSMILKRMWDDPKLALTPEQKTALEKVRNETIASVKQIAKEVKQLTRSIVKAARSGTKAEALYGDVDNLAALKAKATKIQLDCISKTQAILTPQQLQYVNETIRQKRAAHRAKKKQGPRA